MDKITVSSLAEMKRTGKKISALIIFDYHMAQIADRANVDIVSAGNSVGPRFWGQSDAVTLEQMIHLCQQLRRGVKRAILSCDFPDEILEQGTEASVSAAERLAKEGGAEMLEIDLRQYTPENLRTVREIVHTGIPVSGHFGIFPPAVRHLGSFEKVAELLLQKKDELIQQAKDLENAGASILNVVNSGPVVGAELVKAVKVPIIGGLGGGPWLDGRATIAQVLVGYDGRLVKDNGDRYANVASVVFDALTAHIEDVRAARPGKGDLPAGPGPGGWARKSVE